MSKLTNYLDNQKNWWERKIKQKKKQKQKNDKVLKKRKRKEYR